ncbi:MAG: SIR2 family protein, partial [Methanosarcinales archaeon]|nr:SIR2 family protein [Methanosarcinales archaeon]
YRKELGEADYCNLPDCLKLNRINPDLLSHRNLFIIKLHGSCNWIKSDGTPGMIIGRGKNEQIQKEPLLKYYFEVFKETLSHCQRRLLIIGYGFGDEHINQIIAESVRNYRLKIYIISPESMPDFRKKILDRNKLGIVILDGISGYFPYNLMEIFPEDYKQTQQKINLFESFFE